jgi:hypothetical protein
MEILVVGEIWGEVSAVESPFASGWQLVPRDSTCSGPVANGLFRYLQQPSNLPDGQHRGRLHPTTIAADRHISLACLVCPEVASCQPSPREVTVRM